MYACTKNFSVGLVIFLQYITRRQLCVASFYEKITQLTLKFFVHEGFMQHAECIRTALVLSFHLQVRF